MKRKLAVVLIILLIALTGCKLYPQPEDTITKPTASNGKSITNKNLNSVVSSFIPVGATIDDLKGSIKPIQTADMDGDGTDEIIAIYKQAGDLGNMGIIVLKKGAKEWENIFVKAEFVKNITKIFFADITGDNYPELFVEHDNSISSCVYVDEKVYCMFSQSFTDYRIEDLTGMYGKDDMKEIIIQEKNGTELRFDVLRWVGGNFYNVTYEYPDLKKETRDFYNQLLKSNPKNIYALQGAISFELSENNYSKALEFINKAETLNKTKDRTDNLLYQKATCLEGLGKYDEAIKIYKSMSTTTPIAYCYIAQKKYDKAREIIKSSSQYQYDGALQEIDAAEAKDKIFNYINTSKKNSTDDMLKSLSEWGKKENIVITYSNPKEPDGSKLDVFLIDYSINPSKAYGKEGVGGHLICWIDNNKPFNISINHMKNQKIIVYTFWPYKAAESNVTVEDGGRLKLNIKYEFSGSSNQYKLPVQVKRIFKLYDGFWKEFQK